MTFQNLLLAALPLSGDAPVRSLLQSERDASPNGITTFVRGEALTFPYRLYCLPDRLHAIVSGSTSNARPLALCLGTRHHDGRVREACLRQLGAIDQPWAIPFLIQLLGEYVAEIVELAAQTIAYMSPAELAAFVAANPGFMSTTRSRAISYWNCYHRGRWSAAAAYPAVAALDAIERVATGEVNPGYPPLTPEQHRLIAAGEPPSRGKELDTLLR
ncbi:hypothetical protein ACQ86G_07740 [Roseateles chitinivorans]|uniref:hypothetical protein n=1 Tax=Roseateles chitinivorans TaxID=2917965 RepID=UPI003D6758C1